MPRILKLKKLFVFLAVLCFIALGAHVFYTQKQATSLDAKRQHETALIEAQKQDQEEKEAHRAEIQALFDTYLNDFKAALVKKASAYKKSRLLLIEFTKSAHYKDEASAKENYMFLKKNLVPSLRIQSGDIIALFEHYSHQIEDDLQNDKSGLRQEFLSQWKEMTKEHLLHYVDFFVSEDELIDAYDALVTFYYTHSKRYTVDKENGKFVFANPKDEAKAQALLDRINALSVNK